jgi:hypothetical protein
MKNFKLLSLVLALALFFTGCTGDATTDGENTNNQEELPAYTEEIIEKEPSPTYLPRPLKIEEEDDGGQNACVQIEQGGESEVNTLLPLVDSTFDDAEDMKDTKWTRIGNSVEMEIVEDGFAGNCLKYNKDASKDASFHSAFIDIKPKDIQSNFQRNTL